MSSCLLTAIDPSLSLVFFADLRLLNMDWQLAIDTKCY